MTSEASFAFSYSPTNGSSTVHFPPHARRAAYWHIDGRKWFFNPYTGARRGRDDVLNYPYGQEIAPPNVSIKNTLDERGARYGDFEDYATIAQDLQDIMRAAPGWGRCDKAQRQALAVIANKIARILNGDPRYLDNWHDIQGYAKLVEDMLLRAS